MTINQIFDEYTAGSEAFCIAVETHCGIDASREEIERIADASKNADEFMHILENEGWWLESMMP